MPVLVKGLDGDPVAIDCFLTGLEVAHDALVDAATTWTPRDLERSGWGRAAKRQPVVVPAALPMVEGGPQPFAEVINQLATIERLIDALRWAIATESYSHVHRCNPTTSNIGHDLVVGTDKLAEMVFEVSDVAGSGNSNGKMHKDLMTLLGCPVPSCPCGFSRKMLAVSDASGAWLQHSSGRLLAGLGEAVAVTVHDRPEPPGTWIVEVARKGAPPATPSRVDTTLS